MGYIKSHNPNIILYIIIISLSVSLAFTLGSDNRNLLLIGIMSLMPLVILLYLKISTSDIILGLFMLSIIIFPLLMNPLTMRWTTVLYSCMFCATFLVYTRVLHHSNFVAEQYAILLKWLICAYTIVLLIQQFCVLTGLPIFNLSNYDPQTPWKLNSLTSEPSHSARIVGLLMYCYIYAKDLCDKDQSSFRENLKKNKWIWLCFFWTMVTMISASAIIFIFLVLLKFFNTRYFLTLISFGLFIIIGVQFIDFKPLERTTKTIAATLTFDEDIIMKADGSAAARVVPTVKLIKTVTIFSKEGLFGHGIDELRNDRVVNMSKVGYGKEGMTGGSMTLWYDYGFIAFLLWIVFSLKNCVNHKDTLVSFVFWFFLVFLIGVNNQIVWVGIILLYTNKKISLRQTNP